MLQRAERWRPSVVLVRRLALVALVAHTGIVVTGAAVRLTASGLGCPTVPKCTDDSLVTTPEMGVHGVIEFGNRLLTFVVLAATVAALVAAVRQRPRRRVLALLAAGLLAGIVVQVLLGAVTVLTGLDPLTVAAHFLVSMALVATAVVLWTRAGESDSPPRPGAGRELRLAGWAVAAVTAATLVVGTVVTGTGPHSGDKDATDRLPLDLESVTQLHADLVFLLLGASATLWLALRGVRSPAATRAGVLVGVLLAQGVVGLVQYATDLPVLLVGVHVLGACLVWIGAVRLLLALHDRPRPV